MDCGNNTISVLDIANLTKLTYLDCTCNIISILTVNNLTNLTYLNCAINNISVLTVDNLINLRELNCSNNHISVLTVDNLINLTILITYEIIRSNKCKDNINLNNANNIAVLNIEKLTKLTQLLFNRSIITPDIAILVNLTSLLAYDASLNSIDLSRLVNLTALYILGNNLTSLDVTNINLKYLNCENNLFDTAAVDAIVLALSQHTVMNGQLVVSVNPGYPPTQNAAYNHLVNYLKWSIY